MQSVVAIRTSMAHDGGAWTFAPSKDEWRDEGLNGKSLVPWRRRIIVPWQFAYLQKNL
jgi:hypothetical protein